MSDLASLLAITIPLSWAAAVSPVTLSIFLVIMSMTEKPRLAGLSFYMGAIVVLLVTVIIGIFLGQKLSVSGHADPTTMAAIDIFLGAVLFLLGFRNIVRLEERRVGKEFKSPAGRSKNRGIAPVHQVLFHWNYSIFNEFQHGYLCPGSRTSHRSSQCRFNQ